METQLPPDFSECLKSLNETGAEYLVVGGYAVIYHGYPRATGDIDIWIRPGLANAERVVRAFHAFGFDQPTIVPSLFMGEGRIVRMGIPPHRIEVMTSIDGVSFDDCWEHRVLSDWDGLTVPVIGLTRLRTNKRASGRPKDLADLDELPEADDA